MKFCVNREKLWKTYIRKALELSILHRKSAASLIKRLTICSDADLQNYFQKKVPNDSVIFCSVYFRQLECLKPHQVLATPAVIQGFSKVCRCSQGSHEQSGAPLAPKDPKG